MIVHRGAFSTVFPELTKGSDDEPRDDHGRWTSGGGGDVADQHAANVKAAIGTDKFEAAHEALGRLSREQVNNVTSKLGLPAPASQTKEKALQRIRNEHNVAVYQDSRMKLNANYRPG